MKTGTNLVHRIAAFAFAFAMAIPRCQWRHRCVMTLGKFLLVLYSKPLWRKEKWKQRRKGDVRDVKNYHGRCWKQGIAMWKSCAFYNTPPSKNPSKNLCLSWIPCKAPSKNPSKKHLLAENLLRTLLRVACGCITPLVCDTPMKTSTKDNFAILSLQASRDMKGIVARPLSARGIRPSEWHSWGLGLQSRLPCTDPKSGLRPETVKKWLKNGF